MDDPIQQYIEKCTKESFTIIGKEGSTKDGEGFIQRLWEDANSHFHEIAHLAKKDNTGINGSPCWILRGIRSACVGLSRDGSALYLSLPSCGGVAHSAGVVRNALQATTPSGFTVHPSEGGE